MKNNNIQYDIDNEPIVISKSISDLFLKQKNPGNCMALYWFYYQTAKWQKTNQPKATTLYVANGLGWSVDKVRKTKNILRELGLIEDVYGKGDGGQFAGMYVLVKFIWGKRSVSELNINNINTLTGSRKNGSTEKTGVRRKREYGENGSTENTEGNALSINNKNALSINNKNALSINNKNALNKKIITTKKITPKLFNNFWELYPKKIDKGKCLTLWTRICTRQDNVPTWSEIKKAIHYQKQSERWQDAKFIPHPSTWLNQSRWLDDPAEMKIVKFDYDKPKPKTTFGHLDAVTPIYEDDDSY